MLSVDKISCSYGPTKVFEDVSLHLKPGLITCIVGPSGCGKSSLLRCIAGFEPVQAGEITINNKLVSSTSVHLAPENRRIGMVFQDYALFPHLTISQNIGFGIGRSEKDRQRIAHVLQATELTPYATRYPHQISGGQQQRVAIARALAPEPDLLLLDEPFSNLDPELREKMKREVRKLLKSYGVTAIIVTHNQDEAFDIADEMGIIAKGRMQQWGQPYDLYHRPANRVVAEFLGRSNFLPIASFGENSVETTLGRISCGNIPQGKPDDFCVLIRPDDLVHDDASPIQGIVTEVAFRGMYRIYELQLDNSHRVQCFTSSHHELHKVGSRIGIRLDVKHAVVLPVR